jgi:hypothetical protein
VSQAADQEQPVSQQQEDEGPPSIAEMRDYFIPGNILLLFQHSRKEDVAKLVTPQMLARLFLGIVLEKTLLSGTCNYVSSTTQQAVHDLDKLAETDWKFVVFKCLQTSLRDKGSYLHGCVAVYMVSFRSNPKEIELFLPLCILIKNSS